MRLSLIGHLAPLTAAIGCALIPGLATAQQVSPMNAAVSSYSDQFLVRLDVGNPYPTPREFRLVAFSEDGAPVEIWTATPTFELRPNATRKVIVTAPFAGASKRKILVCAETAEHSADGGTLRGQVCSTVEAQRR